MIPAYRIAAAGESAAHYGPDYKKFIARKCGMATSEIGRLDRQIRIGEQVRVADRGGSAIVTISTPACHAEIALQGAQVLSWRPNGQPDVLWC